MNSLRRLAASLLVTSVSWFSLIAQTREAFDAASIKVNTQGGVSYPGLAPGGKRFTATNLPLTALIMVAYDATPNQISGVPAELNRVGYDIEAESEHPMTRDEANRMLQNLLADRFRLKVHRETREEPTFALIVSKSGARLRETTEPGLPDVRRNGATFTYKRAPMSTLTLTLSQEVGRNVVDKTGLGGRYDFTLEYARENPARPGNPERPPDGEGLPSIYTALQQQIGLQLQSERGPVEYLVVDHAEALSAN